MRKDKEIVCSCGGRLHKECPHIPAEPAQDTPKEEREYVKAMGNRLARKNIADLVAQARKEGHEIGYELGKGVAKAQTAKEIVEMIRERAKYYGDTGSEGWSVPLQALIAQIEKDYK